MTRAGDTVAAVSSPPGPGRRGVLRITGPRAADLVRATFRVAGGETRLDELLAHRTGIRGRFDDGRGDQPALLLWMPGPASYTREDVAELHLPGSPPLLERAFARLLELGAAPAPPGEFTRRAFLNGRLDLAQAEGVLELVGATTEAELRAGMRLLSGGLSRRTLELREALEDLRSLCEASLDFDEADTGHVPADELAGLARTVGEGLERALAWEVGREAPSALPRVVLAGLPNAGKSSLFNALVPEERALVSDVAGTTRDGLVGLWRLGGGSALLVDGPGLVAPASPASADSIGGAELRAQELAAREREAADLELRVVDAATPAPPLPPPSGPRVLVWSRVDRPDAGTLPAAASGREAWVATSAVTGQGLEELAERCAAALGLAGPVAPAGAAGEARQLSARHRRALVEARAAHLRAREHLAAGAPLDLVAEALREATDALDGITGRTGAEDLLDRIFARFCIGK